MEEFSPMKPVNGNTRENFKLNSPARRLQMALASVYKEHQTTEQNAKQVHNHFSATARVRSSAAIDNVIPPLLLIHGICDDVVPFTSTAEAARVFKSCGVARCDEVYLAETGHQDVIFQIMLGGPALDATFEWIKKIDDMVGQERKAKKVHGGHTAQALIPSKL